MEHLIIVQVLFSKVICQNDIHIYLNNGMFHLLNIVIGNNYPH